MITATHPSSGNGRKVVSANQVLATSNLPEELKRIVRQVVDGSRLWRSEKGLVARELCAHFEDGIAAGVSTDQLARDFGDVKRAGMLISRARRRLRPLWWRSAKRALQGTGWALASATTLYAILAARYFLVEPTISRNYLAEINAAAAQVSQDDKAWPRYLAALSQFGPAPELEFQGPFQGVLPGNPDWDAMVAWMRSKPEAFASLRAASAMPSMGLTYRQELSAEHMAMLHATGRGFEPSPSEANENPLLVGVLLPHLGEMRKVARWLRSDAVLAAQEGDSARFLADVDAMLGVARHAAQDPFMISACVGVAIGGMSLDTIATHALKPGLLTDAQVVQLAHRVAGFAGGRVSMPVERERLMLDDVVQRFYSDDGQGDGRLVHSVQRERISQDFGVRLPSPHLLSEVLRPVSSAALPSRREVARKIEAFSQQARVDDALPPWRHAERRSDALFVDACESGIFQVLPVIKSLMVTDMGETSLEDHHLAKAFSDRDIFEAKRSAVLALLAAESFRRSQGRWPIGFNELVPGQLPTLPFDPFTGQPLRYRLPTGTEAHPVIYSVGPDGLDDRGVAPATKQGREMVYRLRLKAAFQDSQVIDPAQRRVLDTVKGDWIIVPVSSD